MVVPLTVVENRPVLDRLLGNRQGDHDPAVAVGRRGLDGELKGVQGRAGIPVGDIRKMCQRILLQEDGEAPVSPVGSLQRLLQD